MHNEVYNFFQSLPDRFSADKYSKIYQAGIPVPYLVIDDFLPLNIYSSVVEEMKQYPLDHWKVKQLPSSGVRKESKDLSSTPLLRTVVNSFTSNLFVSWLKSVTGNQQIIPDVELLGAGLSSAPSGSYLGLHVDFNWNDTLRLNRKFNLLLYLNESWETQWGGELEMWNLEQTQCLHKIDPLPNRLIFWEHDEKFLHGFSSPIKSPSDVERQNLMIVYYNSNGTPTSDPHKSLFY